MIYRHTDQDIQYYFANTSLNQSSIKVLIKDGIQAFIEQQENLIGQEDLYYEEKEHFIVGNAVDCILTRGKEVFDEKYAYSVLKKKPSPNVMSIVQKVFAEIPENQAINEDIMAYDKELYDSCDFHQYYMDRRIPKDKLIKGKVDDRTWEDDKRVENFLGDGTVVQYWLELIDSKGKQLLSEKEKDKILTVSNNMLTHKHTAHLFKEIPNTDTIYQMPLYFVYDGVYCKMLPDMIIVNHNTKKILLADPKTTGDYILNFNYHMKLRRYDIQGAFYRFGVSVNKRNIGDFINKDINDYEVSNMAFIVESTKKPGTPLVFPMTDELTAVGTNGDGRYLKGWIHGVELYKSWKEFNFSLDERFASSNGMIWLDPGFEYTQIF